MHVLYRKMLEEVFFFLCGSIYVTLPRTNDLGIRIFTSFYNSEKQVQSCFISNFIQWEQHTKMALSKALEEDFFLVTYWIEFNYKITKNQVLKALKAIIHGQYFLSLFLWRQHYNFYISLKFMSKMYLFSWSFIPKTIFSITLTYKISLFWFTVHFRV